MEEKEFNSLFRDLISHLYDYTVLETHLLINVVSPPNDYRGSKGEYIREMIIEEIERFKPEGKAASLVAIEWRPYNILIHRYVEGASLQTLSHMLSISERQLRRDNSRALQALAGRIWEKLGATDESIQGSIDVERDALQTFDINQEVLELNEIIEGIADVLDKRIKAEGLKLRLDHEAAPIHIMADRVITRQILISLISYFLNCNCKDDIQLCSEISGENAQVVIYSELLEPWSIEIRNDYADLLESALFWSQQINASIAEAHPLEGELGLLELTFSIPLAKQAIILVVDDQKPTQQMFRRFLNRTSYQVVGVTDPSLAPSLAQQHKPVLITLDVMMPKVDGWEILQVLQTDPDTKDIPVLVCSAWEEPELARSLGAVGFLKKPIRQGDLLQMLNRLNL
jgi:CheY-like chemotaxis protein